MALWKGARPTVVRAIALNIGMLCSYEESKERLAKIFPDRPKLVFFLAGCTSGAVAATVSLPFDNVKTKLQNQVQRADGSYPYSGFADCARKSIAKEGVTGLWIGLPTYITRIAPHAMISLMCADLLRSKYNS